MCVNVEVLIVEALPAVNELFTPIVVFGEPGAVIEVLVLPAVRAMVLLALGAPGAVIVELTAAAVLPELKIIP